MSSVEVPHRATASPRLQHLQILRAIAASLVVVTHTFSSLQPHGLDDPRFHPAADLIGGLGVAVFFVISGLIMVRHSAERFGTRTYPFVFAAHRLIRIVPIYWIATGLWYASLRHSGASIPSPRRQLTLSLLFIPDFLSGQSRLNPILGQGWTLNYEMAFYLLFALALFLRRCHGIAAIVLVIVAASACGSLNIQSAILHFYTERILLFFAAGVLLGAVEIALTRPVPFTLPIPPALLLLLPVCGLLAPPAHTPDAYSWFGLAFATALVALCTLTMNQRPGWCTRALVLLGDASYSTYLFHLWVFGWTNPRILRVYAGLHRVPASPFAFIAAAVVAANILGLAVHLLIERPITQALRKAIAYTFSGSGTFSPRSSTSKLST